MLLLRKTLLSNKFYLIVILLTSLLTGIRLFIPKVSQYSENSKKAEGIITKIEEKEDYNRLYLKNKETLIITTTNSPKELELGDEIIVYGTFHNPSKNTTKYLFNYEKYCKRNNIFYLINSKSIQVKKKNKNIYYKIKNSIKNRLGNNPYLNTFLLGDKTYLKEEAKESYQENGISHLFAISGMHISLLAKIIESILKRKKLQEEAIFKITSTICIFYLFLVGFSPSIVRGVLFYIGFSMNRIYYFYITPKNLFLLLLSISLLINPYNLLETGFQYSYLISFALIVSKEKLQGKNYFHSLLKVSYLSFLVSIPITSYYFYQINILSILYNLLFVPFVSLLLFPFSLIVFIIKPLEPIYLFLATRMENISIFLSHISFGKIILKRLPIYFYGIELIIIILYLLKNKKIYQKIVLFLIIFHIVISYISLENYIEFLDVGQGDSTIIHLSNENILIDTGGKEKRGEIYSNILKPYFKSRGIHKINYLILTHGDKDHMGDASSIIKDYKVENVILNCGEHNDLEKEFIKELKKKRIDYYSCIEEVELKNNTLYFLNTKLYDNENDNSNVIYTEINNFKLMFMGDAGKEREKDIIEEYELSNIDILKVGHHGSNTSTSKEFIKKINPEYAIISVGKNNRYGHPNKEVLNSLEKSKVYRTDLDGSILFKIKNNKLKIETNTS